MCRLKIPWPRAEAWWAFFVAIFTGLLFLIAWKQLEFGHVIERAYIVAKPTDNTVRDLEVGKFAWVQLAMDKDGHTPAYHVKGTQVLQVARIRFQKKRHLSKALLVKVKSRFSLMRRSECQLGQTIR
jgi:hypothetical protein